MFWNGTTAKNGSAVTVAGKQPTWSYATNDTNDVVIKSLAAPGWMIVIDENDKADLVVDGVEQDAFRSWVSCSSSKLKLERIYGPTNSTASWRTFSTCRIRSPIEWSA
jgi:hypothetical protein